MLSVENVYQNLFSGHCLDRCEGGRLDCQDLEEMKTNVQLPDGREDGPA
jgi:hypothetical protein